ncbi:MAG: DUF4836 family protein [Prevotella sp.]|nr:DUF4836 family protein [Prevotella sp.]
MKKKIVWVFMSLAVMFSSCSDDDYLNVIPGNSMALLSIDMQQLLESSGKGKQDASQMLCSTLGIDSEEDMGIDVSARLFLFESQEGALGMVAKVDDRKQVEHFFKRLAAKGICQEATPFRGNLFTVVKGSWVVGIGNTAVVVMGPALPAQHSETISQISAYFKQGDDMGIKSSPLMERLESMSTPVALVAQAAALPEMFAAPFTLGAPEKTDASQILIAAEIACSDGTLRMKGETFSLNKRVNEALVAAKELFRPISGAYIGKLSGSDFCSLMINTKGEDLLGMIRKNRMLTSLLTGVNTAIDMNRILQGVDGEVAITAHNMDPMVSIHAQLADDGFLKDVDYWMKSCPDGASIRRDASAANAFVYQDKSRKFLFGVTSDKQFYGQLVPNGSMMPSYKNTDPSVSNALKGEIMCVLLHLDGVGNNEIVETIKSVMSPIAGDVSTIILTIR